MTNRPSTAIDQLSNQYVTSLLDCTPELVTALGHGSADEGDFSDYSPEGLGQMNDLHFATLRQLAALEPADDVDRITKAALTASLESEIEDYERGEVGDINVIASPLQGIQEIYDNMAQESAADWELIARRLSNTPKALRGWQETLKLRAQSGPPTAAKQIELAIDQAEHKAGPSSPLADLAVRGGGAHPQIAQLLEDAAAAARAAYGELAAFLREEILPHGAASEAFGRERYEPRIRAATGARLDLDETYDWGLAELARIVTEQETIVRDLYGDGVSIRAALDRLNADPAYQVRGKDALKAWMQETSDRALDDLHGAHFDIPDPLRKLECMIAPSGTGAIYYTGPSDDFSRGGRMWWSVPDGTDVFHTWQEKTTVYHEGVPGHHLQLGMATYVKDSLNDWRRNLSWNSGHGEGWALYAEGLMAELGYHDDPADYMGVLDSERLRATRVVLDIGFHLGKPSPRGYEHISPVWTRAVAWQFLQDNVAMDRSFLAFELNRYLGWAGQAPSYKVGHRIWKQLRADAEARAHARGEDFSLKDWHMRALQIGSVGLDVLRDALEER
ncbi:DUF885 domain-containing protein [Trueperella pyogenes]|uniref:DUF885 domain-containing protein n=1 Tax=Trueperella pyogenes TaxID=1661 RepID=A0A3Q9GHH8_9ACTO|nr:DUF885 domain-containing protein [Trueperella pyogenes]AWG04104.1 DUF885 domain-containing protein [Trueperella pyogenes]AWG16833.1 DUF885 domain-containing protein [Trueperella pyogenes]AZR03823.1 DUF885 domain-containing protein [Trueperella pyogenes]AZR06667.1 DUF885 domain-containing protein [Trueperella pyogenes]QIU86845.1 DUF885 domain-containing protein [Trueperella pyogenes]